MSQTVGFQVALVMPANRAHSFPMPPPAQPVTLSPEQIAVLSQRLSSLRHNVNNHLALMVAAAELLRRQPEQADKLLDHLGRQPDRITEEIRAFSELLETALQTTLKSGLKPGPRQAPETEA